MHNDDTSLRRVHGRVTLIASHDGRALRCSIPPVHMFGRHRRESNRPERQEMIDRTRALLLATAAASAIGLAACGGNVNASVGGTVSGLGTGLSLTLQNNNTDTITVNANGAFQFPTQLQSGAAYAVTIRTQPTGQSCSVANGTGSVDSAGDDVSSVTVACITTTSISGSVTGLKPGTAVTLTDGTELLPVAINGAFAFQGTLPAGTAYTVTVATQPAGETCTVTNGAGTIQAGVATGVTVTCS
jgi:hypothetical protein